MTDSVKKKKTQVNRSKPLFNRLVIEYVDKSYIHERGSSDTPRDESIGPNRNIGWRVQQCPQSVFASGRVS